MSRFVAVPPQRLQPDVLLALLREFASRDGTDYGERECPLDDRIAGLQRQLHDGELQLLYDLAGEQWDLLPRDQATRLLDS